MTEGLEAITTALVSKALDAASLRHQAIAANIANVNTLGYVPQKLEFEAQLDEARRELQSRGSVSSYALASLRPRLEPVLDAAGVPLKVQLDGEMVNLAENSVQYQALTRGLARHFAILSSAVSDGRK